MYREPFLISAALLAAALPGAAQQPLSVRDALERAQQSGYANRMADAQARATSSTALSALRGILPTLRFEAGYVRTTDPIGAFGTTLRQRSIEPADFDPHRLNHPPVASNYGGAVVLEAPLLNGDAYLARMAAVSSGRAARAAALWTSANVKVEVIAAYYGAVLSAEKVRTLEGALQAAQAHMRQAENLVKAGLVTKADALLASVKAGEVEAQLLEAESEQKIARQGLAVILGDSTGASYALPEALPNAAAVRAALHAVTVGSTLELRGDVRAATEGMRAARLDAARATAQSLPRLNAFGRYDWNSASRVYGGEANWTVGMIASWTPFAGAAEIGDRRASSARAAAATAGLEATRARAELDLSKTRAQCEVAVAKLAIAERSTQQSAEAHRIVARKYQGGLATVVELLEAAASETQSQLFLAHAQYSAILAAAEDLRARGADPAALADHLQTEMAGAFHEVR